MYDLFVIINIYINNNNNKHNNVYKYRFSEWSAFRDTICTGFTIIQNPITSSLKL